VSGQPVTQAKEVDGVILWDKLKDAIDCACRLEVDAKKDVRRDRGPGRRLVLS